MFKIIRFLIITVITAVGLAVFFEHHNIPAISNNTHIELPIIMYHSVLKDSELSGKYIITPDCLIKDLEYLEKSGYTTITAQQLIDYTTNNTPLPEKPVMLTFDDGCYNNYEYVLPILKSHNAHGIFAIVGKYTDSYTDINEVNTAYGYMRWLDVYNLSQSSHAEIANHSYDFHKYTTDRRASKKKSWESLYDYQSLFRADTEKMQTKCKNNADVTPVIYAYPFGEYSKESLDVLKELGFKMSFTCNEGINIITKDPDCLFFLKRNNRPSNIETAVFFENIK